MNNALDWPDWKNGKPDHVPWSPNEGQCICEIHRAFAAQNGYTVNQWYAMNPDVTQEWMERCPGCPERQASRQPSPAPAKQTKPSSSRPMVTPAPVKQPTQAATATKAKPVQEHPMSEPTYQQPQAPIYHDTTPTPDPALSALLSGVAVVGVAGIVLLATLVFGVAILAAMPISASLVLAWKFRGAIWQAALAVVNAIVAVVCFPFVLAYRGAQRAIQTIQQHQTTQVAKSTRLMLTGPAPITDPARLLEVQQVEPIEFAARPTPVSVKRPSKKVKVKQ